MTAYVAKPKYGVFNLHMHYANKMYLLSFFNFY